MFIFDERTVVIDFDDVLNFHIDKYGIFQHTSKSLLWNKYFQRYCEYV